MRTDLTRADLATALNQFDQVVVTLDGSLKAERALPIALVLARQGGLPLTLVTAPAGLPGFDSRPYLDRTAAAITGTPVTLSVARDQDPAARAVLDALEERPRSLAVMSTHVRPALGELLAGSVAQEVVRHSPVPVVLVGPRCDQRAAQRGFASVVICVDGDSCAARIVPTTLDFASTFGLQRVIFEVLQPVPVADKPDAAAASTAHLVAADLDASGNAASWRVAFDARPEEAILAVLSEVERPLVALAPDGRRAWDRMRRPSTTVAIAHDAAAPVLAVGPAVRPLSSLSELSS